MKIFHAINPNFDFDFIGTDPAFPDGFELIAEVNADSLDDAYSMSQHLDDMPWHNHPNVSKVFKQDKESVRSTSAGDVVEHMDTYYKCKNVGWEIINKEFRL